MIDLTIEAKRIFNILTHPPYLLRNGMISRSVIEGKGQRNHLLSDLGDYLPFFYVLGQKQFCVDHINKIRGFQFPKELVRENFLSYSYDFSDFLLGLAWFHKQTKNAATKVQIDRVLEILKTRFHLGKDTTSLFMPAVNWALPIFDLRDGTFLEIFVDYKLPGDSAGLYKEIISTPLFRDIGLLPAFQVKNWGSLLKLFPKYSDIFKKVVFIKHISNPLHGVLAMYRQTGSQKYRIVLEKASGALIDHFLLASGFFVHEGDWRSGQINNISVHSASNHTAIDFFCDLAYFLKNEEYLNVASKVANAWLSVQGKTGLFPISPKVFYDDLDSQTDMFVALKKLYELTEKKRYLTAANRCLDGTLKFHRRDGGYLLSVDIRNGRVADETYKSKFMALFLKALFLANTKQRIFKTPELYDILKDR